MRYLKWILIYYDHEGTEAEINKECWQIYNNPLSAKEACDTLNSNLGINTNYYVIKPVAIEILK